MPPNAIAQTKQSPRTHLLHFGHSNRFRVQSQDIMGIQLAQVFKTCLDVEYAQGLALTQPSFKRIDGH